MTREEERDYIEAVIAFRAMKPRARLRVFICGFGEMTETGYDPDCFPGMASGKCTRLSSAPGTPPPRHNGCAGKTHA